MRSITTWNETLKFVSEFRKKGYLVTNFYPNETEMSDWIKNGKFFSLEVSDAACFFVHKTEAAAFIYFFVKELCDLKPAFLQIIQLLDVRIMAYDYICKTDEERNFIKEISTSCGFELHTSLRRMSFILKENIFEEDDDVTFAELEDIDCLFDMFNAAFDPVSERIPTKEQLKKYIKQKAVLICRKQRRIAGFAVVEIQKKTMYLKHLLTNSDFRRQGIAEKILKKAFFLSKGCIRFILWVIDSNTPAISLYKKFGYNFETLSNYTFVLKSINI